MKIFCLIAVCSAKPIATTMSPDYYDVLRSQTEIPSEVQPDGDSSSSSEFYICNSVFQKRMTSFIQASCAEIEYLNFN